MNDWIKARFVRRVITSMFNTIRGKRIAVLGFSYKAHTTDTRDTASIDVCRGLLLDGAALSVYDPKVGGRGAAAQRRRGAGAGDGRACLAHMPRGRVLCTSSLHLILAAAAVTPDVELDVAAGVADVPVAAAVPPPLPPGDPGADPPGHVPAQGQPGAAAPPAHRRVAGHSGRGAQRHGGVPGRARRVRAHRLARVQVGVGVGAEARGPGWQSGRPRGGWHTPSVWDAAGCTAACPIQLAQPPPPRLLRPRLYTCAPSLPPSARLIPYGIGVIPPSLPHTPAGDWTSTPSSRP